MSIIDGSAEYQLKTTSSTDDLTSSINNLNISTFAHTFLDDNSANEVRNTLDLISQTEQGYRQPNFSYGIGKIVLHNSLPIGKKLVCIKDGTTSNEDLIILDTTEGTLINDGTIVWAIDSFATSITSATCHNSQFRGINITSYFDSGYMSNNIANGNFSNIYPGDYIIKSVTIDGTTYQNVKWIVMDCDYHLNSGDTQTTTHHVVLMPEGHLGTAQMNETNTTEGGYQGSKMWTTTIPLVNAGIKAAFGDSHVLSHRELLTKTINATAISGGNSTLQGCSVDWSWVSVEANICNEQQVYGTKAFGSSAFDIGDCYNQFAAFRLSKALQSKDRYWFWLRSVASASWFCRAYDLGNCDYHIASDSHGLRPYFLLK